MRCSLSTIIRRIQKQLSSGQTQRFYYNDNWQVLAEAVVFGSNELVDQYYLWGNYIDEALLKVDTHGTVAAADDDDHYYLHDHLYSTVAVLDDASNVEERYEYDAYGKATIYDANFTERTASAIGNAYLFTGRRLDPESGIYYYRNRYYSPTLGRFLQNDPLGYVDSMNMYQYCGDNALYWIDPMGLKGSWSDCIYSTMCDYLSKPQEDGSDGLMLGIINGTDHAIEDFDDSPVGRYIDDYGAYYRTEMSTMATPVVYVACHPIKTCQSAYQLAAEKINEYDENFEAALYNDIEAISGGLYDTAADMYQLDDMNASAKAWGKFIPAAVSTASGGLVIKDKVVAKVAACKTVGPIATQAYPPNDGFLFGAKTATTLKPGTMLGRYGAPGGSFLAPYGTPFNKLGLPYYKKFGELKVYKVMKSCDVDAGIVAPAYGSGGGGIQYMTGKSVKKLLKKGVLKEIK